MINDRDIVNTINYSDFCKATGISEEYAKSIASILLEKECSRRGNMLAAIFYIRSQLDKFISALNTIDMNLYSPLLQEEIKTEALVALLSGDRDNPKFGQRVDSIVESYYPTLPIHDFDFLVEPEYYECDLSPQQGSGNEISLVVLPPDIIEIVNSIRTHKSSRKNKNINNLIYLLKELGINTSSRIDIQGVQVPTKVVLHYFPDILQRFCDEIEKNYAEGVKLEFLLPPIIEENYEKVAIIALHNAHKQQSDNNNQVLYNNRYKKALAFLNGLKAKKRLLGNTSLLMDYKDIIRGIVIDQADDPKYRNTFLVDFVLGMVDCGRNGLPNKKYLDLKNVFLETECLQDLMPIIITYYDDVQNKGKLFPLKKLEAFLSNTL